MRTPELLTFDECSRDLMKVTGICRRCGERKLELHHGRLRPWWSRPIKKLFEERRLACGGCGAKLWAVRVDSCGNLMFPGETVALWEA